jgi:YD repeat-containing protein
VRRQYDAIGRLEKVRTEFNGNADYSYTRWTYPATGNMVNQYSTITDGAGEAYSFTKTDGLGRSLFAVTEHPDSIGGYSTTATEYDALGRPWKQSVPTETNAALLATGDDALGYLYRTQTFDWKGRPLISTNTDGTITEASYGGCGCAGGETVTLTGEQLAEGRRRQKIYSDSLGRQFKTEILNYDQSVYSSTVTEYNERDQVRFVKQYAGAATGTPGLQSETQYDGHGRVWRQHAPPMLAGAWTTYAYNANDTAQSVTDARNVVVNYLYNKRRLLTDINYAAPSGITATAPVSFQYDAAGNRTQMVDGLGATSYFYDQFSRLTAEAKPLPGLSNLFSVGYEYSRSGQLKSVTDHFGQKVSYNFDATGRLSSVNNAAQWGYGANTAVISGRQYRAFGGLKQESYGSGYAATGGYNARLQLSNFTLTKPDQQNAMQYAHQYNPDGGLRFSDNLLDERFDRAYSYDQAARMVESYSGSEARTAALGTPPAATPSGPYRQSYQYDALHQTTQTVNRLWSSGAETTPAAYLNGRITGWEYDAAGRVTRDGDGATYKYDAAGRLIEKVGAELTAHGYYTYDGAGALVKDYTTRPRPNLPPLTKTTLYQSATGLGGVALAELNGGGAKVNGNIFAGGRLAATADNGGTLNNWRYNEPVTGGAGASSAQYGNFQPKGEYDPSGVNLGFIDPSELSGGGEYVQGIIGGLGAGGCSTTSPNCVAVYLDGMESNWDTVLRLAGAGALNIKLENARGDTLLASLDVSLGNLYIPDQYQNTRETGYGAYTFSTDDPNSPIIWDPTAPYDLTVINLIQGGFVSTQELKGQSPCEQQLARLFTDDPKAVFVDVTDGDGFDPIQGSDRSQSSANPDTHNHLYNDPKGDLMKNINIYAPPGGTIVGVGEWKPPKGAYGAANFINIRYAKLGAATDVVLQIWHVEPLNKSLIGQSTGDNPRGLLLGSTGANGVTAYLASRKPGYFRGPRGDEAYPAPNGVHIHVNLFKYKNSGIGKRSPGSRANRKNVNLNLLCK